jgi:hypothetical protein
MQRISPEKKEVSPYTPLYTLASRLQKQKAKLNLHVALLAISFPKCNVTFMFQFFFISLLCHPFPACLFFLALPLLHIQTSLLRDPCHGIFPFFRRFRDSGPMHKY